MRLLRLICILLLAASLLLAPATPSLASDDDRDGDRDRHRKHSARIDPALRQVIARNPASVVDVIVQKRTHGKKPESKAHQEGWHLLRPLPLINGFALRLPARAVEEIADEDGVHYVSLDAPLWVQTISTKNLANTYNEALKVPSVWNGLGFTGRGVTVAVLDTGVNPVPDLQGRIVASIDLVDRADPAADEHGHATHVAGVIAGHGAASRGKYIGIAPEAQIASVRVADANGMATTSSVIEGLYWAVARRATYNIRVANISLTGSVAESYLSSPLAAAVEATWNQGIAVVASAGNGGAGAALYPPASDPFVVTVGATDTNGTGPTSDDLMPTWSAYGTTQDGFVKPDVVAPGRRIVSTLASPTVAIARLRPDRITDGAYFRLSGTSLSAAAVSGVAALAFQAHPTWTPNQLKWALAQTAECLGLHQAGKCVPHPGTGAGYVRAHHLVAYSSTPGQANQGIKPNLNIDPSTGVIYGTTATWTSATWTSATWTSATSATWISSSLDVD